MAFLYYSPVSINGGQVPTTQTDFPILASFTDNRFKSTGNGGHVQSTSGFDIRPYTDSTLTTAITGYELERYNAGTGEVVMWVKISSLSSSTTPLVLAYGNSSLTSDGSSTTTWSNSFISVFHLKDGTTLNVSDGVGANNATNHGATAAAGQIDGAASFVNASSQYIDFSATGGGDIRPAAITTSVWAKATSFPNAYNTAGIMGNNTSVSQYFVTYVKSTGKLAFFVFANADVSFDGTGATTLSTGTWYYLTMTYSSAAGMVGYINAVSEKTVAANGALAATNPATTAIGRHSTAANNYWDGILDEVRVASVVRSADWITTEYNNQNSPSAFETLGAEVSNNPMGCLFRI